MAGNGPTSAISLRMGTDPTNPDSDGDGMADWYEVAKGFNPLDVSDGAQDADGDGLSNVREFQLETDPFVANTLNVGYSTNVVGLVRTNYGRNVSIPWHNPFDKGNNWIKNLFVPTGL